MMKSSDKYNQLKTTSLFVLLPMFLLFIACGKTEIMQEMKETTNIKSYVSKGDTMLYGLACDGCSDSVLVFLPDSGGHPINYSILEARLNHQVFGRPRIGDRMAVLVDTANPKALMLAKNADYGEAWRDMRVSSYTDIILTKIARTKEIENHGGKTLVSEGIAANYQDMIN